MKKLYGVTTAMVTPFQDTGEVDLDAVAALTDFLVEKGVNCLYPLGTTGEMIHMNVAERKAVAETVVRQTGGRCTVFIHCGGTSQEDTIALTRHACEIGADGVGVVTPIFLGVNDREMTTYFTAVAKSVPDDFPIYLYGIPQCAANDLGVDVVAAIASECGNVVGIKYSYADMIRTIDYLRIRGGDFSVLHGCDSLFLATLGMGCDGTISGNSSVYPEPFVALYKAWLAGDMKTALNMQNLAIDLIRAMGSGSNMAYFKAALKHRGIKGGHMRAPQLDLEETEKYSLIGRLEEFETRLESL